MNVFLRQLAAASFLWLCVAGAAPAGSAGAQPSSGPCTIITKADVHKVLRWSVQSLAKKPYNVAGRSGTICEYVAKEGSVILTVPEAGSSFLGTNPLVEPQAMGEMMQLGSVGSGASAEVFDGVVYVRKPTSSVSVKVQPNANQPTDFDALESFAKIAARRMP